jgi:hypothetical protein
MRAPREGHSYSITIAMDFLNRDGSLTEGWDTHDVHHPIFVCDSLMPTNLNTRRDLSGSTLTASLPGA